MHKQFMTNCCGPKIAQNCTGESCWKGLHVFLSSHGNVGVSCKALNRENWLEFIWQSITIWLSFESLFYPPYHPPKQCTNKSSSSGNNSKKPMDSLNREAWEGGELIDSFKLPPQTRGNARNTPEKTNRVVPLLAGITILTTWIFFSGVK